MISGIKDGIINAVIRLGTLLKQFTDYVKRVLADSGLIRDQSVTRQFIQMAKSNSMLDSIRFAWLGEAGYKHRTSGMNTFWTKLYSLIGTNDATQTTSTNQPYLSGNIAPNEKWCLKNPNGGYEYMTHPTITFAANEAWSVTTVITPYGSNAGLNSRILGNDTASKTRIELAPNGGTLYVYGETANGSLAIPNRKGKRTVFHITYNGAGVVSVSISGSTIGTININDSFVFNTINRASGGQYFFGENSGVMIRAGELTLSQKQAEANFLRSLYPEIPSVTIGSQVWATSNCEMAATPQGNLIQNVTLNSNVEKITNAADREFSSDTGFWEKSGDAQIIDGVGRFTGAGSPSSTAANRRLATTSLSTFLTPSLWYKVTYSARLVSGTNYSFYVASGNVIWNPNSVVTNEFVTYTHYFYSISDRYLVFAGALNSVFEVDNVSIQEVGWSDSTNLYDYVYANTTGTVEQKTTAAVKAAAMWCYYNNDTALGAVYGKLYNWYAVKLLQMDIDYYNAANPTAPWGWRVPTDTDFSTLATTLGVASVAGGKMKKEGTVYWSSPNTGATNSSGFSAIGAGLRIGSSGSFAYLTSNVYYGSIDFKYIGMLRDSTELLRGDSVIIDGAPLRLIKQ